jgi:hypothetical protein
MSTDWEESADVQLRTQKSLMISDDSSA